MDRPRISCRYLAFLAVLFCFIFHKVSSSGEFQVRLLSFTNDQARDLSGNCCNGDNFTEDQGCTTPCHTYFRICLFQYYNNIPSDSINQCTYGSKISSFLGNNTFDISSEDYTVSLPFSFEWRRDFSLIIQALHLGINESMENSRELSRLATQRRQGANATWTEDFYTDQYHRLDFSYRIICADSYYSRTCAKKCVPRDDFIGHYICNQNGDKVCREGWTGRWCDEAVCDDCIHGTCKSDQPGVCECQTGYEGDRCDQCIPLSGCLYGTCSLPGQCICNAGWGGTLCNIDNNYCTHNSPCRNGGTCRNEGRTGFRCYCTQGYTGADCSIEVDLPACPCENGGSCIESGQRTICSCPPGTTGVHCEFLVTGCQASRCQNGATCEDIPSGYHCLCKEGFYGNDCEKLDICASANNPCINGGSCLNQVSSYQCLCAGGFSGRHCEVNICASHTCANGGSCIATADVARCECVPGFSGEKCEIHPNYCDSSPCVNGGSCNELPNGGYYCDCALGFRGINCEFPQCEINPCENGGSCSLDHEGGILCTCAPGYAGVLCSDSLYPVSDTEITTTQTNGLSGPALVYPTHSSSIGENSNEFTLMLLFVAFGVIVLLLVLLLVLVIYRKHKSETRQRDIEEIGAPPNNRAVLTYRDNFSHEEKVLPLLSISEKVCNKELDNFKSKTTLSKEFSSISNSHTQSVSNSINKDLTDFSSKDLKSLHCAGDRNTCTQECSSNVVRYVPQTRHSFPRNCDSDEFYYYDDKKGPLKRTDSLQTNSPSSSVESTPKHTAKCPILQISAVVEDAYPAPVRLHASEV